MMVMMVLHFGAPGMPHSHNHGLNVKVFPLQHPPHNAARFASVVLDCVLEWPAHAGLHKY